MRPAKTQINLGVRPVWSASSLSALSIPKDLYAGSEGWSESSLGALMIFFWFCRVVAQNFIWRRIPALNRKYSCSKVAITFQLSRLLTFNSLLIWISLDAHVVGCDIRFGFVCIVFLPLKLRVLILRCIKTYVRVSDSQTSAKCFEKTVKSYRFSKIQYIVSQQYYYVFYTIHPSVKFAYLRLVLDEFISVCSSTYTRILFYCFQHGNTIIYAHVCLVKVKSHTPHRCNVRLCWCCFYCCFCLRENTFKTVNIKPNYLKYLLDKSSWIKLWRHIWIHFSEHPVLNAHVCWIY